MSTGFFLLDNPQRLAQGTYPRRRGGRLSGAVVVHTAENVTDDLGDDLGAESVARYLTTRANYGSYHRLCDSDSTIPLLPWEWEAWHDTTSNGWTVGISGAVRSADWPRLHERGNATVMRMALAAQSFRDYVRSTYGIEVPPRWLTRDEVIARKPGFVRHGVMDPRRRTDPGDTFPAELFLATYADGLPSGEAAPELPAPLQEDTMLLLVTEKRNGAVWVGNGITRRHVPNQKALDDLRWQAQQVGLVIQDRGVVERVEWLGEPVDYPRKA